MGIKFESSVMMNHNLCFISYDILKIRHINAIQNLKQRMQDTKCNYT